MRAERTEHRLGELRHARGERGGKAGQAAVDLITERPRADRRLVADLTGGGRQLLVGEGQVLAQRVGGALL